MDGIGGKVSLLTPLPILSPTLFFFWLGMLLEFCILQMTYLL